MAYIEPLQLVERVDAEDIPVAGFQRDVLMVNDDVPDAVKQPFKTELGFHVFKIEEIRDVKVPSFDEAKQQLARQMQNAQIEKTLVELRNKAKIQ